MYLAAIAFLCFYHFDSIRDVGRDIFGIDADKVAHFLMFLPFPLLFYLSFDHPSKKVIRSLGFALSTLALGLLIAALTEYVQSFLPYRAADKADLVADAIAIGAGTLTVLAIDLAHIKKRGR